jgi:hypothetical protein
MQPGAAVYKGAAVLGIHPGRFFVRRSPSGTAGQPASVPQLFTGAPGRRASGAARGLRLFALARARRTSRSADTPTTKTQRRLTRDVISRRGASPACDTQCRAETATSSERARRMLRGDAAGRWQFLKGPARRSNERVNDLGPEPSRPRVDGQCSSCDLLGACSEDAPRRGDPEGGRNCHHRVRG